MIMTDNSKKAAGLTRLNNSLHQAENKQLHSFLKQRSQALDEDIKRLSDKLKLSPGQNTDVHALLQQYSTAPATLVTTSSHDTRPKNIIRDGPGGLQLQGKTIEMRSRPSLEDLANASEVSNIISKFQRHLHLSGISNEELREILFPAEIVGSNNSTLAMSEFLEVLNLDLMMSLSMREQQVLLNAYGIINSDGQRTSDINVKAFLVDADAWTTAPTSSPAKPLRDEPLVGTTRRLAFEEDANTKANISALQNIHELVRNSVPRDRKIGLAPSSRSALAALEAEEDTMSPDPQPLTLLPSMDIDPPEYPLSSHDDDPISRELEELKRKYAQLEAASRKPATAQSLSLSADFESFEQIVRGAPAGAGVRENTRLSLRELDRGTSFSNPALRPQATWSHPARGERPSIPSLVASRMPEVRRSADLNKSLTTDEFAATKRSEETILQELLRLPQPMRILHDLVHKITQVADHENRDGYISCSQLQDAMLDAGLRVTTSEVELFAAGFGGNGNGCVAGDEVRQALESQFYESTKYTQSHALQGEAGDASGDMALDDEAQFTMKRLAGAVLEVSTFLQGKSKPSAFESTFATADQSRGDVKRDAGSIREGILKSLLKPFETADHWGDGILSFTTFHRAILQLCEVKDTASVEFIDVPTKEEIWRVAEYFLTEKVPSHPPRQLPKPPRVAPSTRVARALSKVDMAQYLNRQDSSAFLSRDLSSKHRAAYLEDYSDSEEDEEDDEEETEEYVQSYIEYYGFCRGLLVALVEARKAMRVRESKSVKSGSHSASQWLLREFQLLELLTSQLLAMPARQRRKAIMKLSHSVAALVTGETQVPMSSANAVTRKREDADGFLVLKFLSEAGFKFEKIERVQLLRSIEELGGLIDFAELCQILIRSCSHWSEDEKSIVSKVLHAMGASLADRRIWIAHFRQSIFQAVAAEHYGVKKSSFKTKPRANAKAEEPQEDLSAVLDKGIAPSLFLRCLRDNGVFLEVSEEAALLDCLDMEQMTQQLLPISPGGAPTVQYKAFLSFCARHVGHWSESFPELHEYIKQLVCSISDPHRGIQELAQLFRSFADKNSTSLIISERAFMISCSRSRLLADLPLDLLRKLASILCSDDESGRDAISFAPFLIHLQVMSNTRAVEDKDEFAADTLASLLLQAVLDSHGTLRPLRVWMETALDEGCVENGKLSDKQLMQLLKHFKVPHRPGELSHFVQDVCRSRVAYQAKYPVTKRADDDDIEASLRVSSADVLHFLQEQRGDAISQRIGSKIYKFISFSLNTSMSHNDHHNLMSTALRMARGVTAKLRAFSAGLFVEADVFKKVVHSCGILLSNEDIDELCDATDTHPSGNHVRYTVITEAVLEFLRKTKEDTSGASEKWIALLRTKLQPAVDAAKKAGKDYSIDVRSAFSGFDPEGLGIISKEDLLIALQSLHIIGYEDIFRMISTDYVPYLPALAAVFRETPEPHKPLAASASGEDKSNKLPPVVSAFIKRCRDAVVATTKSREEDDLWGFLFQIFAQYDDDESFAVSAKEFAQALVLIMRKEEALPQHEDWRVLCEYFRKTKTGGDEVDYMAFCEMLVGYKEQTVQVEASQGGGKGKSTSLTTGASKKGSSLPSSPLKKKTTVVASSSSRGTKVETSRPSKQRQ